jgi:hypothetical protein
MGEAQPEGCASGKPKDLLLELLAHALLRFANTDDGKISGGEQFTRYCA